MKTAVLPDRPRMAHLFRMQYHPVQTAKILLYPQGMDKLHDRTV